MKRHLLYLAALSIICLAISACDSIDPSIFRPGPQESPPQVNPPIVVRLVGNPLAQTRQLPDGIPPLRNGETQAIAFDMDLEYNGRVIGTATDYLGDITPVGDAIDLEGTTVFNFPGGTLISRGQTTVQPLTTSAPSPVTHTTGAIPFPSTNNILGGTGIFNDVTGTVRLSGAVNLSEFSGEGTPIGFDCLFVIQFDSAQTSALLHQRLGPQSHKYRVVQLRGERINAVAQEFPTGVPPLDNGENSGLRFEMELLENGEVIGTATDYLSNITPVGDGIALVGTTVFNFPEGTLISRGQTTVQPVITSAPSPVTHTTGSVPMAGTNSVILGTGIFRGATGSVRLGGAVNMSEFSGEGTPISFDCFFVIDLD